MADFKQENKLKTSITTDFSIIVNYCEEFGISKEIVFTFIDLNKKNGVSHDQTFRKV